MSQLLWFAVPLLFVAGLALVARRRQMAARHRRQQAGLQSLQTLRQVLDLLQQHRGLTTGFLSGSEAVLPKIEGLQRQLQGLCRQLDSVDALARNERWSLIREHWTRLSSRFRELAPADNLRQHTQLIQSLLYLIDDHAQQSDLMLLETREKQPLHLAWRELLTAVECIGQARAVGTGAVAAGRCDTVTRIRLTYLCQKIERTSSQAWQALPPSPREREQLEALMACIRTELIEQRQPDLDVDTYFGLASRAIEGLYSQYDESMSLLGNASRAA